MKKAKWLILASLVVLLILSLCSCTGKSGSADTAAEVIYYTVKFNTAGGSAVESVKVVKNGLAPIPQEPVKEGYIFECWELNGKEWVFGLHKVEGDITLTAKWIDSATVYDFETVENTKNCIITGYKRSFECMRIPNNIAGNTVIGIGDDVFVDAEADEIAQIIVPDTVKIIGKNTFKDCAAVKIQINGSLESVGECAFYGCEGLEAVSFGEGLEIVSPQAFGGCIALKSVMLPRSVKTIDENAFEDCVSLEYVALGGEIEKIADGAFIGCDALKAVYFYGTEQDFDNIDVLNGNDALLEASLYVYSAQKPQEDGRYWYYSDNGKIIIWRK